MAQPAPDHVDLDASLEQVHGGGVPEDVRADPPRGGGVVEACAMTPHDFVDAEARERLSMRRENRRLRRRRWVRLTGAARSAAPPSAARAGRSATCRPCRADVPGGGHPDRGVPHAHRRPPARAHQYCRGRAGGRGRAAQGGPRGATGAGDPPLRRVQGIEFPLAARASWARLPRAGRRRACRALRPAMYSNRQCTAAKRWLRV